MSKISLLSLKIFQAMSITWVWMQSMGFPTYCLVVTITEKVRRMTEEMHQCRRNTELSMCMWETLIKVFKRRNMSSIVVEALYGF